MDKSTVNLDEHTTGTISGGKDWFVFGAVLAYFLLFSYAIYRSVTWIATPRVAMVLRFSWAAILVFVLILGIITIQQKNILSQITRKTLDRLEDAPPWARAIAFLLLILIPVPLVYTHISRGLMQDDWMRVAVYIPLFLLGALVLPLKQSKNFWGRLALTILSAAFALLIAEQLSQVNNFPFSIGWSEGNRFYDYSLIFGKNLYQYQGDLQVPYYSPGRYGLWGIWFLIPNLPIGFHRFWNAVLWFLPPLIFGWFATRGVKDQWTRFGVALWASLFLNQGPIYAPLLLAGILLLAFNTQTLWKRMVLIGIASAYAGLSRWTWLAAPGAWGVLMVLFSPKAASHQPWKRRSWIAFWIALAGSLPGFLANLPRWVAPKEETLSLSQPLLWYRLLPNATYQPGILLGIAIAALPLAILIVWLIASKRWKIDWLQLLAISVASLGFLTAGLVASTKIGGGSNLHNLDMFLVTLIFVIMLYLDEHEFALTHWPLWTKAVLAAVILTPAYFTLSSGQVTTFLSQAAIDTDLVKITTQVSIAKKKGEVLFMDQRQLLTFGYIRNVKLVPEYEKKYMMDQAMAGDEAYFKQFYKDLAEKRFALILSEPLYTNYQDLERSFAEENNAWVKWVSDPIMCYYTPKGMLKDIPLQFLVPREGPVNCP